MTTKDNLVKHLVDSTAMMTIVNPVMAAMEVSPIVGMTNQTSINARGLGTLLTFAGLSYVYTRGRELSKKTFRITKQTSEKVKQLHDTLYTIGYCVALSPPFYLAAGSRDFKEIAMGTLVSGVSEFILGSPTGYAVDSFKDFAGIEESERLPAPIKRQSSRVKKGLIVLVTAASIATLVGIYSTNNYINSNYQNQEQTKTQISK